MGLAVDFYEGRNNCDLTPWLEYFVGTMAKAAKDLHERAVRLQVKKGLPSTPWDTLARRQQQVMTRLLAKRLTVPSSDLTIKVADIESWFAVSDRTAREWLTEWTESGFVSPITSGAGTRIHRYELASAWKKILE